MRRLVVLLALLAVPPAIASANKTSNPAFLGVEMSDSGGAATAGGRGACFITNVERGSGAEAAALQPGDVFEQLDGAVVPDCNALVSLITARNPGAIVRLVVRRRAQLVQVPAELLTRDEILRRRLVGHRLPLTELVRVDDLGTSDLSALKRTTIVGWYSTLCSGCDGVLSTVARWSRDPRRDAISVVAATPGDLRTRRSGTESLEELRLVQRSLDVPLLAVDYETYKKFAIKDVDRVYFMVLDARGVVQYVAPIAPNTDDTRAVLDELFAAAEQTARRTR